MKSLFNSSRFKISLVSVIIIAALGNLISVRADVAPPEPPYGTNPIPGEELTNVRMMSEIVNMNIDSSDPQKGWPAKVEATFNMRNLGEEYENLQVRFPLNYKYGPNCAPDYFSFIPSINDLKVWVNDVPVETQTTTLTYSIEDAYGKPIYFTVSCWANFPVIFPAGKDVTIKVTYTAEPYRFWQAIVYEYKYILITGAGWKGTIGKADISIHFPYALNKFNFDSCKPDNCHADEHIVSWHYEDLEPNFESVTAAVMIPSLWQNILDAQADNEKNPNDGEVWGRLGKAYKEAIMGLRGLRSDLVGIELYNMSRDAYQKAVTLLPNDADWHYGFAELLCNNAYWNYYTNPNIEEWKACLTQLQQALIINPEHEKTIQLLDFISEYDKIKVVDLNGDKPDFLLLTPKPTEIEQIISTTNAPNAVVTHSILVASPTVKSVVVVNPTSTVIPPSLVNVIPGTSTALENSNEVPEQISAWTNIYIYFGIIVIVVFLGLTSLKYLKKAKK